MIPGTYNPPAIYQGDHWEIPKIKLISLVPWGGPPDLNGCDVSSRLERTARRQTKYTVHVDVLDRDTREVRLYIPSSETEEFAIGPVVWDLQVKRESDNEKWTPMSGTTEVIRDVTS